jgi:pilus assembly protein Flp/PilA
MNTLRALRDDAGATMVEYGLMLALIMLVAFAAVAAFGGSVSGLFRNAADLMP